MKDENPGIAFGEVGRKLGELWKAATPEDKAPFEEQAVADKVPPAPARPRSRYVQRPLYIGNLYGLENSGLRYTLPCRGLFGVEGRALRCAYSCAVFAMTATTTEPL